MRVRWDYGALKGKFRFIDGSFNEGLFKLARFQGLARFSKRAKGGARCQARHHGKNLGGIETEQMEKAYEITLENYLMKWSSRCDV